MSSLKTETLKITGMFCPHCEKTVSKALLAVPGVESVSASYPKGQAVVTYDPATSTREQMAAAVKEAGYAVDADTKGDFIQILSILILLVCGYVIARHLGWLNIFNVFPTIEGSMALGALFVVGLMTSIHCIAMCGGINLTQSTSAAGAGRSPVVSNLQYNLGRVISYTATGALCGAIGQTIGLEGKLRGILPAIVGVIMLLMALRMLGIFRSLRRIRLPLPKAVYRLAARVMATRSSFLIGLLNGLMPCGPLQSMQLYALGTGSVLMGALSMLSFSLGTVPLMFAFGFLAGKLNQKYRNYMLTVSAVLIFVMGLNMLFDGLALSGVSVPTNAAASSTQSMLDDGVQTVRTEIDYGSYPAITVHKDVPLTWTINVPEGKLNGCNGEIIIPDYDIDLVLHEGDNVLEFTPTEEGTVAYSCWMGMIRSTITVVEQ